MSRIDHWLPRFDVAEQHETVVRAPREQVYAAVRRLDLSGSLVIRSLFLLRGLPALFTHRKRRGSPLGLDLNALLRSGFTLLEEQPGEEIVLGLVGQFWTVSGGLVRVDPAGFPAFDRAGYAKAVWNFRLEPREDGAVRLTTETRVLCLDPASRRRFHFYWRVIGPFSGWIRRLMLRGIRRAAEAASSDSAAKQTTRRRVS
jgi:hypothetical protein